MLSILKTKRYLFFLFLFTFLNTSISEALSQETNQTETDSLNILQKQKLKEEIQKLIIENRETQSFWSKFPVIGSLVTALVAIFGVLLTIWKQMAQRNLDREQRKSEYHQMVDEKFADIVEKIGSDNQSVQASAIVSILSFLKPEYESFHEQVFLILHANLKVPHSDQIHRLLISAFEKTLRLVINKFDSDLNFSRMNLTGINISGLQLPYADFAFSVLKLANLRGCNLYRCRGYQTNFEKSNLSGVNFEEARLRKANFNRSICHEINLMHSHLEETRITNVQFQRALLQSAHFEQSIIMNSKFEGSNLADTYFKQLHTIDVNSLKSIKKALRWEDAHFDLSKEDLQKI